MSPVFERVAVVGLGLLGGSVALAAKRRGIAARVVGSTRREDARERAKRYCSRIRLSSSKVAQLSGSSKKPLSTTTSLPSPVSVVTM